MIMNHQQPACFSYIDDMPTLIVENAIKISLWNYEENKSDAINKCTDLTRWAVFVRTAFLFKLFSATS